MKNLLTVREAVESDVKTIFRLLEIYAAKAIVLSRSEEDILSEVISLRDSGIKEVMLLGQNVNSYGGGGDKFSSFYAA